MYIYHKFLDLDLTWLAEHKDLKLCYVDECDSRKDEDGYTEYYGYKLYFTSVDMKDQWGDDWDDAPYNCNAGVPYDTIYTNTGGGKYVRHEHTIYCLQIYVEPKDAPTLPSEYCYNSPFSVDTINSRAVAWLFFGCRFKTCDGIAILAGMSPWKVFELIGSRMVNPDNNNKQQDNDRKTETK